MDPCSHSRDTQNWQKFVLSQRCGGKCYLRVAGPSSTRRRGQKNWRALQAVKACKRPYGEINRLESRRQRPRSLTHNSTWQHKAVRGRRSDKGGGKGGLAAQARPHRWHIQGSGDATGGRRSSAGEYRWSRAGHACMRNTGCGQWGWGQGGLGRALRISCCAGSRVGMGRRRTASKASCDERRRWEGANALPAQLCGAARLEVQATGQMAWMSGGEAAGTAAPAGGGAGGQLTAMVSKAPGGCPAASGGGGASAARRLAAGSHGVLSRLSSVHVDVTVVLVEREHLPRPHRDARVLGRSPGRRGAADALLCRLVGRLSSGQPAVQGAGGMRHRLTNHAELLQETRRPRRRVGRPSLPRCCAASRAQLGHSPKRVAPPAVPHRQLVVGHRVSPGVAAAQQPVLLAHHQHQVLSQHLFSSGKGPPLLCGK